MTLILTRRNDNKRHQFQIEQLRKDCESKLNDKQRIHQFEFEQLKKESDESRERKEFQKRSLLIRFPKEELKVIESKARDNISKFGKTSATFKEFAELTVNLLVDEFKLSHSAIFWVDTKREFANMLAGTGEGGKRMVERGHKWNLLVGHSAVSSTVTENAVCIDVFNLPFMGIFYCKISSDPQDFSIPPFEFLEKGGFGCPDLPETRQRLVLPLRTENEVVGALDIHTNALDMGRESVELLLPIANLIANIGVNFEK